MLSNEQCLPVSKHMPLAALFTGFSYGVDHYYPVLYSEPCRSKYYTHFDRRKTKGGSEFGSMFFVCMILNMVILFIPLNLKHSIKIQMFESVFILYKNYPILLFFFIQSRDGVKYFDLPWPSYIM